MKLKTSSANRAIVAMLGFAALAAAFWILLLSPKREELGKLDAQVGEQKALLAQHQAEVVEAEAARDEFPAEYRQLVVLGKAVPGDDDVASLLVQMNRIAANAGGTFRNVTLSSSGEGESGAPAPTSMGGEPASATEVAASLLPLGASVGPAGLGVMPYALTFDGNFFQIADFIKGLDSLVKTSEEEVTVKGRLVTVDGFSLTASANGFPALDASFSVTTYLTPPSQGVTGGATPSAPGEAVPAATSLGGAP